MGRRKNEAAWKNLRWKLDFGGVIIAGCQAVVAESRAFLPGSSRTCVVLQRLLIDDADTYMWLTRIYPEDAIPPEAQRDLVLRGPKDQMLSLMGAAPIWVGRPMEMQRNRFGILGEVVFRVNDITQEDGDLMTDRICALMSPASSWDARAKAALREDMKGVPRDARGRWMKIPVHERHPETV